MGKVTKTDGKARRTAKKSSHGSERAKRKPNVIQSAPQVLLLTSADGCVSFSSAFGGKRRRS